MFFAYHRRTSITGRVIAEGLGLNEKQSRGHEIPRSPDFLIRWGISRGSRNDVARRTINVGSAVFRAGDKLATLQCLQGAGIRVPDFVPASQMGEIPSEGTWLARMRRGFGGRDIQVCVHTHSVPLPISAELFTKFVPNNREYRIHVVNSQIVRVQRKYLEYPDMQTSEYVKNHANGYVFKTPRRRLNESREEAAVKAVEALGLDFGAVDLLVDDNSLEYVLEVNTAPACSPRTANAYITGLANLVNERSGGDYVIYPVLNTNEAMMDELDTV